MNRSKDYSYALMLASASKMSIGSFMANHQKRKSIHLAQYDTIRLFDDRPDIPTQRIDEEGYSKFKYAEYALEDEIVKHFNRYFPNEIRFRGRQVRVKNKVIDIVAESDKEYFLLELKIERLLPAHIYQLHEYMQLFSDTYTPSKQIYGIIICPGIWTGGVLTKHYPNIFVMLHSIYNHELLLE